jgi:hypothetical protein
MEVTTSFYFHFPTVDSKNMAGGRTKFEVRAVRSGQNGACVVFPYAGEIFELLVTSEGRGQWDANLWTIL